MTAPTLDRPVVSDDMLARFRERAPGYDRTNTFFQEDWDELKAAGFMTLLVPREFGSRGSLDLSRR